MSYIIDEKETYFNNQYSTIHTKNPKKKLKKVIVVSKLHGDMSGTKFVVIDQFYPKNIFTKSSEEKLEEKLGKLMTIESEYIVNIIDHSINTNDDGISFTILIPLLESSLNTKMKIQINADSIKNKKIASINLKKYIQQLANAVAVLHNNDIIHGNIKPNNILFDDNNSLILTDFEFKDFSPKKFFKNDDGIREKNSLLWASPEQLNDKNDFFIDKSSDIWSLGIILFQMIQGEHPFAGNNADEILISIESEIDNMKQLENVSKDIENLIERCLYKDPNKRFKSINEFINDLNKCSFTKTCKNGHINEYSAIKCDQCNQPLDEAHFEIEVVKYDNIVFPKISWVIPPLKERHINVEIYPSQETDFDLTEKNIYIDFEGLVEPIKIPLLPAPNFSINPKQFEIKTDGYKKEETLTFDLILDEGEAIIEKVILSLEEQQDAIIETKIIESAGKWLSTKNKEKTNTIKVQFSINMECIEAEKKYHIQLEIKVKNRNDMIVVNSYNSDELTLTLIDPPTLHIYLKEYHIFTVQKQSHVKKFIKVGNTGGGKITIEKIYPSFVNDNEHEIDLSKLIIFDDLNDINPFDKQMKPTEISFDIYSELISLDINSLSICLNFNYYDNENVHNINNKEITVILEFSNRQTGQLFALDFGTTNSYWTCFTKDYTYESMRDSLNCEDGSIVNKEGLIPSLISYNEKNKRYKIGHLVEIDLLKGISNIFHSFKLDIGQKKLLKLIYNGQLEKKEAEKITKDFLAEVLNHAKNCTGFDFEQYIFTHPSRMPLRSFQAFKDIIENRLKIENYHLIDEATAAAFDYIKKNLGKYNLLVYDFGGGTIDITYMRVNGSVDCVEVECIETDGLPDFGGNNITEIIKNILVDIIKQEHEKDEQKIDILLPGKDNEEYKPIEDHAYSNNQVLWSAADEIKKNIYSDEDFVKTVKFKYQSSDQIKESQHTFQKNDLNINDINDKFKPYLEKSLNIVKRMISQQNSDENLKIILSGGSAKVPYLKNLFEEYRKDFTDFKYNDEDLEISSNPKKCVAEGALICRDFLLKDMLVIDDKKINWSRFGLREINLITENTFVEYIPKNKKLCPVDREIQEKDKDFSEYAVCKKKYRFFFLKSGKLRYAIDIYEHFGAENEMTPGSCSLVGSFTFDKPPDVSDNIYGFLRIEINTNYEIKVKALINGNWINANEI